MQPVTLETWYLISNPAPQLQTGKVQFETKGAVVVVVVMVMVVVVIVVATEVVVEMGATSNWQRQVKQVVALSTRSTELKPGSQLQEGKAQITADEVEALAFAA